MARICKTSLATFAALFLTLGPIGALAAALPAQAVTPASIATVELA